jgi:hypothetical protein
MRDAQILLRYVAFQLFLSQYRGLLNSFLNDANRKLNTLWLLPKGQEKIQNTLFDLSQL